MQEYRITSAQRRDEWQSKYGPMVAYDLALEGEDGWIRLNQKPETPPPREGESITGNIKVVDVRDGESFRKIQKVNPQYADRDNRPQQSSSSQEGYMVEMLEELTGRRPAKVQKDTVHPVEEPLDLPF